MAEKFEIPNSQKSQPGKQDFSMFLEAYEREKKKISNLDDRIIERLKFLEKETDPKVRQMVKEEIEELREEKSEAREAAIEAFNLHKGLIGKLEKFDPEDKTTGGRA